MSILLKAPAFRQYSAALQGGPTSTMSRHDLVEVLRTSLINAARHDFGAYVDGLQQRGFSTRRYFSDDRGDTMLTSSEKEEDSSNDDDDVIKRVLRTGRACRNGGCATFRMPTLAEFLAEGGRSRSGSGTHEQRPNLKVRQGHGRHNEVSGSHRVREKVFNVGEVNSSTGCSDNTVRDSTRGSHVALIVVLMIYRVQLEKKSNAKIAICQKCISLNIFWTKFVCKILNKGEGENIPTCKDNVISSPKI